MDEMVVINTQAVLGIVVAILLLFGGALLALYKSAPPWVKDVVRPTSEVLLKLLDDVVAKTPNTTDDKLRDIIREVVSEMLAQNVAAAITPIDTTGYGKNFIGTGAVK